MSFVHSEEMKRTLQKCLINRDSFHSSRERRFTFSSAAVFAYLYGRDQPRFIENGKTGHTEIIQKLTKTGAADSWCFCQTLQYAESCALHGVGRELYPSRALQTLPSDVYLCLSGVPGAKYGICTRKPIPVDTWIGPFEGRQVRPDELKAGMDTSCMWEICEDDKIVHFIDGSDEHSSSWMRFIQCARFKDEQNLHAFQYQANIFYRSFRNIAIGEELLVWYDDRYPQFLGIPTGLQDISFTTSDKDVGSSSLKPKPPVLHCTITNHQPSPVSDTNNDVTHPEDSLVPSPKGSAESEFTTWRCQQCHKTFTQRVALQMHVCPRQPEKPLQCGQCSQAFSNATLLRLHVVSHSREKPFKCGFCSRAFAGTTTLNNHIRTHTGQKPFACEACGKTFLQAGQLARHVRDPHECPLRNSPRRGFNKSSALLA